MTQDATSAAQGGDFCAIVAGQVEASVVHEDETVVAFMDLNPVTRGHLHVIPRYPGDGWTIKAVLPPQRERPLLDSDAQVIKDALASTD